MRTRSSRQRTQGLALVLLLLAIVGFVTAFLLYNALGAVSKRLDAGATNQDSFRKLDAALAQFVMLNSRLPCPASGTAHTGNEDVTSPTNTTTCLSPSGVIPWNTLGLGKTNAVDNWGRYIAYRVYDGTPGFTRTNGVLLTDCLDEETTATYSLSGASSTCNSNTHENSITDFFASKGLTVNDRGTANGNVAYALISMGESGLGAYYPGGTAPLTAPSSSSKEFLNAGSGGTYWIMAASDPSVAATDASHFDDVVSYASASDVAHTARLAGRPWKLYQMFTQSTLGVSGVNYNTGLASLKVQPVSAGVNQGPVMLTAAATSSRVICATSTTTQGVAPCTTSVTNGNDLFDTSGNETLTFDFRVTRTVLVIALTDFRFTGAGSNKEQAQVTFYNGSTQVDQRTVQACDGSGHPVAQFTITPSAKFTKVAVGALNITGTSSGSDFGVAAILACKLASDCPTGSNSPAGISWPTIDCYATL